MFLILTIELNGTDDFNYPHGEKKNTLQPQHLTHPLTHKRTLKYMHLLTHTHIQSEYCLPHRGCEGDVSATRTISILITLTPRTASTHIRPLLHYVPLLPPSIPHPFSTLLFSLVSVWVSQSASSSSCWYMLAALTLSLSNTHTGAHTLMRMQASKCPFYTCCY